MSSFVNKIQSVISSQTILKLITIRSSCGKVIFSQASVKNSVHFGGGSASGVDPESSR